jgi:hypothetical protein
MPRTELPSGNWVEWDAKWMSGTRFHVKSAVKYELRADADTGGMVQIADGANEDRQRLALWADRITAWSWSDKGIPIPSQNAGGPEILWTVLDGPDFTALAEATQGLLEEVTAVPTRGKAAGKASSTT